MVQATRQPDGRCFEKTEIRRQQSVPKAFGVRVKGVGIGPDREQEVEKAQMMRPQIVLGLSKLCACRTAGGGAR